MADTIIKHDGKWKKANEILTKVNGKWKNTDDLFSFLTDAQEENSIKLYVFTDNHLRANVDGDPSAPNAISNTTRYHYASPSKLRNFVDIVNKEKPNLVLHLGDMVDVPSDFSFFNEQWGKITNDVRKELTIGNHDYDDKTYTEIVSSLGYDSREELAGSKFNKSFVVASENITVRVIMLDTQFSTTNHSGTAKGNIIETEFVWLQSELNSFKEDYLFICSHALPHYYNDPAGYPYFNETSAFRLRDMVNAAVLSNPKLKKVYYLGGHHHSRNIVQYTNLGENLIGFRLPDTIDYEIGHYTEITITKESVNLSKRELKYPYP